jgi:hypothetical protein
VIIQAGFSDGAYVRFDDENRKGRIPTPEVIDDILCRVERSVCRMNAGLPLEAVDLSDVDIDAQGD